MREDEQVDQFYQLPARLKQAGVLFCLGVDGFWQVRNLPFMAGTAATYGLTKEEALASITSSTAKILGLDDRLGTLEVDKDATFFVSSGDALDMRSNQLSMAFIQGRKIDLNNIQTDLNQRYRNKYGLK
jgi:imidazolonepropionase-like amidohydrolase